LILNFEGGGAKLEKEREKMKKKKVVGAKLEIHLVHTSLHRGCRDLPNITLKGGVWRPKGPARTS